MLDGLEQKLFQQLAREATFHLENLVQQLIEDYDIEREMFKWTKLISATSASLVGQEPTCQAMDPLPRDAVQVEVLFLDHGDMSPLIEILKGVVVRKPVAHRRMRTRISQPGVLLLDGSLDGSSLGSLSSLDSIEPQKLEKYNSIIKSKCPDVLVMTGSISRLFVEEFFESGITIVPDVSKKDMERLKRITGSKLHSIESLGMEHGFLEDPLGSCDSFEVIQHSTTSPDFGTDENTGEQTFSAPIILFKKDSEVFKTLIMRNQDSLEAEKLKEVMKAAVFSGLWNNLEINFLFHFLRIDRTPENDMNRRAINKITGIRSKLKEKRRRILKASPYYEYCEDPLDSSDITGTDAMPFMTSQCMALCVFCSNPNKGCLCEIPHLHSMSFYARNDPSMLQFLSTISPSKVKCKHPACGEMASSHERSFLHGRNLVTVSSSHLDSYQYLDASFAWIWSDSPHSNACVKLPSTALHLSLSHFLLLLLETRCITDIVMHNKFDFHIKQRDILVSFRMKRCSLYYLRAPTSMQENARQQYLWLRSECKSLETEFQQQCENLEIVLSAAKNGDSPLNSSDAIEMLEDIRETFKQQLQALEADLEFDMIPKRGIIRKIDELKFACTLLSARTTADSGEESNINDRNAKTLVSNNDQDNHQIDKIVLISDSKQETTKDHGNPLEQLVLNFRSTLEASSGLHDLNEADARGVQEMYSFIQDGFNKIVYHVREPSSAIASFMSTSVYEKYIANAFDMLGVQPGSAESLKYSLHSTPDDCQINTTNVSCKIYCSLQFHALREVCIDGGNQAFLFAIKRSQPWNAEGGKSNAHFARTLDGQYVIKQLSKSEKKSFLQFSLHYFEHMRQHLTEGEPSFLAKIFGVFQLSIQANSTMQEFDFMILENLFRGRQMQQVYDLKGLSKERYKSGAAEENSVLFDGNLREKNQKLPTFISRKSHAWLSDILAHDTGTLPD
eukprot:jgi/Picsp_1/6508/NSC_03851-R1_protein